MAGQDKLDLFRELRKADYNPSKKPVLIEVKKGSYLQIDGTGAPGGDSFATRVGALYAMAYTIKMTRKFDGRRDYVIGKLEAQWWVDGGGDMASTPEDLWNWTLMIRTPDFVKRAELKSAAKALLEKGKDPDVAQVTLATMAGGRCVQMLHVGPYEKEPDTIAKMTAHAAEHGLAPHGRHHEIYISDPRRVPPDRLKTILRLPVTPL
jgi:hypothetical protein